MTFLILIGIVVLIVWLLSRGNKTPAQPYYPPSNQLDQLNQQWVDFIAAYLAAAKTPAEKAVLQRMLDDVRKQGMGEPVITIVEGSGDSAPVIHTNQPAVAAAATNTMAATVDSAPPAPFEQTSKLPDVQLDNATLLLYFGAFLFVASVGLFVAVGGASGVLRAFAVLFVMVVMYMSGIWLFKNRPKLQQAGLAFTAIGIVMAPLVGLAFYNFVFDHQNANAVWLITSIGCLGLYIHALVTLHKPLLSYLLIFTFLSLFESGISMVSAPIYYLGWGLAAVGIILQLLNLWKGYWPELKDSSRQSSMILLPLSLLVSIVLVPQHGAMQLGFAFVLAAAYYGLEALTSNDDEQQESAMAAQVLALAAVGTFSYAAHHDWQTTALVLLACNVIQAVTLLVVRAKATLWQNYSIVLLVSSFVSIGFAIQHPKTILLTTAGLTLIGTIIWLRQTRIEAYGIAVASFLSLPYIYSLLVADPQLPVATLSYLAGASLLLVFAIYLWNFKKHHTTTYWLATAQVTYLLGTLGLIVTSFFGAPLLCLLMTIGVVLTLIVLAERDRTSEWAEVSGVLLVAPLIASWNDGAVLLASSAVVLATVIGLALRYRKESLRWESTALWLIIPLFIGRSMTLLNTTNSLVIFTNWTAINYTGAYLLVMCALIYSRALARGLLLFSTNRILASYARSASLSYVFGYSLAALIGLSCSMATNNPHLTITAVLVLLMLVTAFLSRYIEKRKDILALIPVLAQATALSLIQPWINTAHLELFLVISTAMATIGYFALPNSLQTSDKRAYDALQFSSLMALFFTPISIFFIGNTYWPMPVGMLVAAAITCYHVRSMDQSVRELAGTLVSTSAWWFLALFHVHEAQAYIHVIIFTLAYYAFWRSERGETKESDNYLMAMLATATVPLAIQAISGAAGGLYGWWLLIEQIVFMLLGMAINKRFVTLWGLYVAVAAVLYQLRHLGWAALTLLAVFLIGVAIYQLQKHSDKD